MSAKALIITKWRFSSLNHQNLEFIGLVPKSPTHTGLICVKTLEPISQAWAPLRTGLEQKHTRRIIIFRGIQSILISEDIRDGISSKIFRK